MSDTPQTPTDRPASSRRQFLRTTGGGLAGASLLTMLDAKQAPAQIKGTTLRILQWSHFIPAYDAWFDNKFAKEWGDKNGRQGARRPHPDSGAAGAHGGRIRGRRRPRHHHERLGGPHAALLQEPGRHQRRLRPDRQEARRMDPVRRSARDRRGQAVRPPDVLHPAADALAEGPLRRQQPEGARHVGAGARRRADAEGQGPSDGHASSRSARTPT